MFRKPCICHRLHANCDPALCLEARSGEWRKFIRMKASRVTSIFKTRLDLPTSKRQKSMQPTSIGCGWNQLADAANSHCPTCQTLRMGFDLCEGLTPAEDQQRYSESHRWVELFFRQSQIEMRLNYLLVTNGDESPTCEYRRISQPGKDPSKWNSEGKIANNLHGSHSILASTPPSHQSCRN